MSKHFRRHFMVGSFSRRMIYVDTFLSTDCRRIFFCRGIIFVDKFSLTNFRRNIYVDTLLSTYICRHNIVDLFLRRNISV